jgi:hypothetical protein
MPDGKRIAVTLGADFDAQAIWLGSFNMPIQSRSSTCPTCAAFETAPPDSGWA